MRISDWSSDVCSSDLHPMPLADLPCEAQRKLAPRARQRLPAGAGQAGLGRQGGAAGRGAAARGAGRRPARRPGRRRRSEEHTSELQSLMRISYAVFCLKKKKKNNSTRKQDSSNILAHAIQEQHIYTRRLIK